jgi:tetratricopeptide (TPR) repeat protein
MLAAMARPADVLQDREGTIAERPLPVLVQAIFAAERTVALELRLRGLEKRIDFEDGTPVACRSNLLHETLGRFLVERGKIAEPQYQDCLQESARTGTRMGEILVARKLVTPFELYRQMQANLAHRILDAFRWTEARYRLLPEGDPPELALRMNPAQLVLTGVSGFLPFEVVATQLAFTDEQRFALCPNPAHALSALKLTPKEARLAQVLRGRPDFAAIVAQTGLEAEDALRRLYALAVLGIVAFAEQVPVEASPGSAAGAPAARTTAPSTSPQAIPAPPTASEGEDDAGDPALRDALVIAYLDHRGKDPFRILGVGEDASAADLRRAFLGLSDRFAPLRFRSPDLREKAEALLLALARAYGALSDPEQLALWRKRRAAASQDAARRAPAAEQFRIATDLLDAGAQFAEGKRRLEAGNARGALEYFQYAFDIEPRPLHRAHLGWARWLVDPGGNARPALQELAEAARADAGCAEAFFFAGEIHRARGEHAEAEEAYRLAHRASPSDRRAQELALEMMRARKRQR